MVFGILPPASFYSYSFNSFLKIFIYLFIYLNISFVVFNILPPASFYSYSFISFLLIIHLYHFFSLLIYIGRRFVLVFNGAEKGRVRKSAKLHFKKLHVNCVSNVFGQRRLTIFHEHMNNVRFHNFSK